MKNIWFNLDDYTRLSIGLVILILLFMIYVYIGYKITYKGGK